jgi:ferritin-like metal-binding protein YciE
VTSERMRRPTSDVVTLYVVLVAPAMSTQAAPFASQLTHLIAYVIGVAPFHVPFVVVSVCATAAVPLTAGAAVLAGAPYSYWAALDVPAARPPVATIAAAMTAKTDNTVISCARGRMPMLLILNPLVVWLDRRYLRPQAANRTVTSRAQRRNLRAFLVAARAWIRPGGDGKEEQRHRRGGESGMQMQTLNDLFEHEIADLYSAEQQLVQALPKLASAASDAKLRKAFEHHLDETRDHVRRLEEIRDEIGSTKTETCDGMKGLIAEGEKTVMADGDSAVKDAALISAAQRVEHYEIAAYGTARTLAGELGLGEAKDLLDQTLDEESNADTLLTKIATGGMMKSGINKQAAT